MQVTFLWDTLYYVHMGQVPEIKLMTIMIM